MPSHVSIAAKFVARPTVFYFFPFSGNFHQNVDNGRLEVGKMAARVIMIGS